MHSLRLGEWQVWAPGLHCIGCQVCAVPGGMFEMCAMPCRARPAACPGGISRQCCAAAAGSRVRSGDAAGGGWLGAGKGKEGKGSSRLLCVSPPPSPPSPAGSGWAQTPPARAGNVFPAVCRGWGGRAASRAPPAMMLLSRKAEGPLATGTGMLGAFVPRALLPGEPQLLPFCLGSAHIRGPLIRSRSPPRKSTAEGPGRGPEGSEPP